MEPRNFEFVAVEPPSQRTQPLPPTQPYKKMRWAEYASNNQQALGEQALARTLFELDDMGSKFEDLAEFLKNTQGPLPSSARNMLTTRCEPLAAFMAQADRLYSEDHPPSIPSVTAITPLAVGMQGRFNQSGKRKYETRHLLGASPERASKRHQSFAPHWIFFAMAGLHHGPPSLNNGGTPLRRIGTHHARLITRLTCVIAGPSQRGSIKRKYELRCVCVVLTWIYVARGGSESRGGWVADYMRVISLDWGLGLSGLEPIE
ncbi:hypothetical protein DFH09DRAFT_1102586 [Mycena vulgaris]|nr:hypothetical protein DFH09DRAFT_1102586 [Mycena vulgaris]